MAYLRKAFEQVEEAQHGCKAQKPKPFALANGPGGKADIVGVGVAFLAQAEQGVADVGGYKGSYAFLAVGCDDAAEGRQVAFYRFGHILRAVFLHLWRKSGAESRKGAVLLADGYGPGLLARGC